MRACIKPVVTREVRAPFSDSLVKEFKNGLRRKPEDKDFVRNWKEKNRAGELCISAAD
jgi:hypothetical protein